MHAVLVCIIYVQIQFSYIYFIMHYDTILNIADVQQVRPGSALVWSWSLWVTQTTQLLLLMRRSLQVHTELSVQYSSVANQMQCVQ